MSLNLSYCVNLEIIMSICPSCKAENPDSYQFCQFCGTKITVDESVVNEIEIQAEDFEVSQVVSDTEELNLDLKIFQKQVQRHQLFYLHHSLHHSLHHFIYKI